MHSYIFLFWISWVISWILSTVFGGGISVVVAMLFGGANGFLILSKTRNNNTFKFFIELFLSTFLVYLSGTILLEISCNFDFMTDLIEGNAICRGGHIYIGFPFLLFSISFIGAALIFFSLKTVIPKS